MGSKNTKELDDDEQQRQEQRLSLGMNFDQRRAPDIVRAKHDENTTLLLIAAGRGGVQQVERVAAFADVRAKDDQGCTALIRALKNIDCRHERTYARNL